MSLPCFTYALYNGVGYKLQKTTSIDKILTTQNLDRLCKLRPKTEKQINWLDTEKLIAVSNVQTTKDEYGREGLQNLTVFFTVPQYLSISTFPNSLNKIFENFTFNPNGAIS